MTEFEREHRSGPVCTTWLLLCAAASALAWCVGLVVWL
jgi:hypothetical protein